MREIVLPQMIDYYRKKNNLTMKDLGLKLHKSESAVSRWIKGDRSPMVDDLEKLASLFGVSVEELMFGGENTDTSIETIYNKLEQPRQAKVYSFAEHQLQEQNNSKIKNLSEYKEEKQSHEIHLQSKVSAGRGVVDLDPNSTETITYYGKLPRHFDMAFKVDGNSMEPVFEDGDIIFVEKMDEIINGALMVVTIENEAFIKKVYLDDDCVRLVSLNKEYDDIRATEGINVIGKVVF